jgi:hypothetical protein
MLIARERNGSLSFRGCSPDRNHTMRVDRGAGCGRERCMRHLFLVAGFIVALGPRAAAQDVMPEDLVLTQVGTLPIILTAPHGGREPIPGIPPRNIEGKPRGRSEYHVGGDRETDVLVQAIARKTYG